MFGTLATAVAFLAEHADLLDLVYEAIVNHGVTKDTLVASIKDAIKTAADQEMKREFPNG